MNRRSKKDVTFAGQKVDMEIWRNGQFKTISVQLNNKP
jgi:DNA-binding transcriptional regulator/RsmH inhibitor MraZ